MFQHTAPELHPSGSAIGLSEPVIAFTGTRNTADNPRYVGMIDHALNDIAWRYGARRPITIVTGGCIGIDAEVAYRAMGSAFQVHTVLPADHKQVDPHWELNCTSYEQMPPGTTYRDRNERMVQLAQRGHGLLYALPERLEDDPRSQRSGTWMTIRIARRLGVPVVEYLYCAVMMSNR